MPYLILQNQSQQNLPCSNSQHPLHWIFVICLHFYRRQRECCCIKKIWSILAIENTYFSTKEPEIKKKINYFFQATVPLFLMAGPVSTLQHRDPRLFFPVLDLLTSIFYKKVRVYGLYITVLSFWKSFIVFPHIIRHKKEYQKGHSYINN